jgi:signal transduction histidine kinase
LGGLALVMAWAMVLHRLVAKRSAELAAEIAEKEHAESERALEMERARVARDLHDELGAGLTEIGMLSSLLEKPEVPAATKSNYIATLRDVSRSLVGGLDEIVWAVNPGYDSVDDAASYLWLQAQRLLKPAGIECHLINREELPYEHLGSRLRHSLLLAFKEAVNNVVRHSQASVVELGIAIDKRTVVVTVADNGIGFDPSSEAQPGSQGLAGMRQRLRELGGDCEITSEKNRGTTVKLILPL